MSSPKYDWTLVKVRFESGENAAAISRSLDGKPSKQAIYNRAKAEGWTCPDSTKATLSRLPVESTVWETLDDRQKIVIEAFALGATTLEEAAARACVSDSTLYRWRQDEGFERLCHSARLQARDDLVRAVKNFGEKEWRPNAWLLEKLWKQEFGQQNAIVQGNTFNILGSIKLGIERSEPEVIDVTPEP